MSFCTKVASIITIDQKLQLQLGSFLSLDTGTNLSRGLNVMCSKNICVWQKFVNVMLHFCAYTIYSKLSQAIKQSLSMGTPKHFFANRQFF